MRYLIVLEQTPTGFAVQVPDLAIITAGDGVESAKLAAVEAIQANLEAYEDAGKHPPARRSVAEHLNNPDFDGLLFTFVEVKTRKDMAAA